VINIWKKAVSCLSDDRPVCLSVDMKVEENPQQTAKLRFKL
jgi:hypothetical protein